MIRTDGKQYDMSLMVVWNNLTERKVVRYELLTMLVDHHSGEFFTYYNKSTDEPKTIQLPKSEIITSVKITKSAAKLFMAHGVKVGGAWPLKY